MKTWPFVNLAIQMPIFYPIARSYVNLAIQMSVFYPIARSYGNLFIQMSVFYPIARSYGNLAIQMSAFYSTVGACGKKIDKKGKELCLFAGLLFGDIFFALFLFALLLSSSLRLLVCSVISSFSFLLWNQAFTDTAVKSTCDVRHRRLFNILSVSTPTHLVKCLAY